MARYTVHLKGTGAEALEKAAFIKDGFSFPAFAFGPFWLFWHASFVPGLLLLAGLTGFVLGAYLLAIPAPFISAGAYLILFLIGFEGSSLRRWGLGLRGYREVAVMAGAEQDGLEQRFFAEYVDEAAPPARSGPVLGLFPPSGRHS